MWRRRRQIRRKEPEVEESGADNMSTQDKQLTALPFLLAGIVAAFLLSFVYGYPRLFALIEASNAENFERNAADAMAAGDLRRALKIARYATETYPLNKNPMVCTVYGRVLLACGEDAQALEQLNKAVNIRMEYKPPYRETRKPFYFAPARLTLGKYYFEHNKLIDAIDNFELARAYAALDSAEYGEFHAVLYRAYAKQGLWARAFEFGEPSDQELDGLDNQGLERIADVCEGKQDWKLADRLAGRLLKREGFAAKAHYLLGRFHLTQEQVEAAETDLEAAAANGHPYAAFFLGAALEENGKQALAIQAFLRTPSGDLFRPFALAKAWELWTNLTEDERASAATAGDALEQLDREIAGIRLLKRPPVYDKYLRFVPVAVMTSEARVSSDGRFPILVLWEDKQSPATDSKPLSSSIHAQQDAPLLLRRNNNVLQLQWVENRVNWASVDSLPAGPTAVPGWIDTARDWFGLRPGYAEEIQEDGPRNSFLSIAKRTWFYSVPIPARKKVGYLLAGRMKGKGTVGWQCMDETDRVIFENGVFGQEKSGAWTWQAAYMPSQLQWDTLRVQLGIMPHAGTVDFDEVMLVELDEPDPEWFAGK